MDNKTDNGSFWFDSLGDARIFSPHRALPNKVDVAIIGAGYTGLWTAYYLKKAQPALDIAVFESNSIGFGASGRNGGWCMGLAFGIEEMLASSKGREQGLELLHAMHGTVDEIGRICQLENIDCHYAKGGTLNVATSPQHVKKLHAHVEHMQALGFSDEDYTWLPAEDATQRIGVYPNLGASYTSHCATIHPARLVHGLADVVLKQGTAIYEATPVLQFSSGHIETPDKRIEATTIIRATEGYTDSIKGEQRKLIPLYSMVVATEPLPQSLWDVIGLHHRETFGDGRRIVIYGQRTADNRLILGGRAGYYFGSQIKPTIPRDDPMVQNVVHILRTLLPVLVDYKITHGWGGLMGAPRHWRPFVTFDKERGLGTAGGYVGEGVAASNLAARILVDLVLEQNTQLAELAWVNDHAHNWEPEPFRWLGAKAVEYFGRKADEKELMTGRASKVWGGLFDRFIG
ncbi:MAG: FAD-binding oxidoreductase [Pseudomonadota bacterium]